MASGKQLSFAYGEVSPSLQYRSDAVSYALGLAKLTNMYVRRIGGVSNRPGFELVQLANSQLNIPEVGGDMGVKAFTFWGKEWGSNTPMWRTVEYCTFAHPDGVSGNVLGFLEEDGGNIYPTSFTEGITEPKPLDIRFTPIKDGIMVTPHFKLADNTQYQGSLSLDLGNLLFDFGSLEYRLVATSVAATLTYVSGGPFFPVSYLLMGLTDEGREVIINTIETVGGTATTPPTNGVAHPHGDLSLKLVYTLSSAQADIRSFTLYRGAGAGGLGNTYYKMVAKVPYDGAATSVTVSDFGADDPSITPPIEEGEVYTGSFRSGTSAAYYQQRLVMSLRYGASGVPTSFKPGDIMVSKIGAPEQLVPPMIFNDSGAFKFSVPITDGTPVVALLGMERLIAFTQRGVYVVRGGEQGILTPTQVNPLLISEEGCSTVVEPTMSGKRGYFINNAHTKMMEIVFGVDGNLEVKEVSAFAEHLFMEDICQLVTVNDTENSIYLLRRDGKLARATATETGEYGFSVIETEGYIESIYRSKAKKKYVSNALNTAEKERYYDVLMAYVIRNGSRYLERLSLRDDKNRQGEYFADAFVAFGNTLATNGSAGYTWLTPGAVIASIGHTKINIKGPLFSAGDACIIECYDPIVDPGVDFRLHFYYEEDGEVKVLECEVDIASEAVTGGGYEYEAYFTADVPAVLQDVNSQTALTTAEKNALKTRWLPAIDRIYGGTTLNNLFYIAGGVNAGVDVAVVADGEILSSPLNPNKDTLQIIRNPDTSELYIEFGGFYANGYLGIPYTSEFETLDIEASDARTLTDANKLINAVGVAFHETRGGFYGMPGKEVEEMEELVTRDNEDFAAQTANFNGYITVNIPAEWNKSGRVNMKHVDPTPVTILSVYPKGISSEG